MANNNNRNYFDEDKAQELYAAWDKETFDSPEFLDLLNYCFKIANFIFVAKGILDRHQEAEDLKQTVKLSMCKRLRSYKKERATLWQYINATVRYDLVMPYKQLLIDSQYLTQLSDDSDFEYSVDEYEDQ